MPTFSFLGTCRILQNSTLLFPTLAYQLADFDEQFKHKLADVLSRTPEFAEQFEQLIQRPWSLDARTNTVLVVLDALDECAEEEKVMEFLDVLLKRPKSTPGKFSYSLRVVRRLSSEKRSEPAKRGIEYTDAVLHETRDSCRGTGCQKFPSSPSSKHRLA